MGQRLLPVATVAQANYDAIESHTSETRALIYIPIAVLYGYIVRCSRSGVRLAKPTGTGQASSPPGPPLHLQSGHDDGPRCRRWWHRRGAHPSQHRAPHCTAPAHGAGHSTAHSARKRAAWRALRGVRTASRRSERVAPPPSGLAIPRRTPGPAAPRPNLRGRLLGLTHQASQRPRPRRFPSHGGVVARKRGGNPNRLFRQ